MASLDAAVVERYNGHVPRFLKVFVVHRKHSVKRQHAAEIVVFPVTPRVVLLRESVNVFLHALNSDHLFFLQRNMIASVRQSVTVTLAIRLHRDCFRRLVNSPSGEDDIAVGVQPPLKRLLRQSGRQPHRFSGYRI